MAASDNTRVHFTGLVNTGAYQIRLSMDAFPRAKRSCVIFWPAVIREMQEGWLIKIQYFIGIYPS